MSAGSSQPASPLSLMWRFRNHHHDHLQEPEHESRSASFGFFGRSRSSSRSYYKDSSYSLNEPSRPRSSVSQPHLSSPNRSDSITSSSRGHTAHAGRHRAYSNLSGQPSLTSPSASSVLESTMDHTRTRRDRTFVDVECAVCEERLELTLKGERVLQFSCGHVSHEACFYQYIKEVDSQYCPTCGAALGLDSSRGGNIIDIEKLSKIVRSVATSDAATARTGQLTPTPWDHGSSRGTQDYSSRSVGRDSRRDSRETSIQRERVERLTGASRQHMRNDSGTTGAASSGDYTDVHHQNAGRRHDYDVQAMESNLSPRPGVMKNLIPAPTVTIRSEFPTLNRSRQQQPLTCLVTIESPEGTWQPDPEMLRQAAPTSPLPQETLNSPFQRHASRNFHNVPYESQETLDEITEELRLRVDNWHGLEFQRFGKLRLYGVLRVGKDRSSWQELECYLFTDMLICVKEKKGSQPQPLEDPRTKRKLSRCALKGSILIKKHLRDMEPVPDDLILTLNLSVNELPCFHLRFQDRGQMDLWKRALLDLHNPAPPTRNPEYDVDGFGMEDDDYRNPRPKRVSSTASSYGAGKSNNTALTDYTTASVREDISASFHVPLDIVVVIPVSSSTQGLKINLLRETLQFLVHNLGPRDRMGLVTFGSNDGGVPLVGMTTKAWNGWARTFSMIRPVGQKSLRADVVEGANIAMDLLMQRQSNNPLSAILLISDSSNSEQESIDFVVSRAEAAKVGIYSFGLGMTHKPDTLIELSGRTKASYTYVKDWMMLRECVAGCLGSLQSISHHNVRLKLRLPEGSPAKFVKISGALQTTKRATGRDAEALLGDLRFGDKRDILVQLVISPDTGAQEHIPQDPWESLVSGLEALGGPLEGDEQRVISVEEVPLLQADLSYGDILRDNQLTHSPRPSLLAITMLPPHQKSKNHGRPITPPIPPHPSIVQRRMELLTSDMLLRALTLISRGQQDRAHHLLTETRSILKGLGKGGLPPLPPGAAKPASDASSSRAGNSPLSSSPRSSEVPESRQLSTPSSASEAATITPVAAVDPAVIAALDAELEAALEWVSHPAIFSRDSRKAVLQAIGVVSSQRAYTFRTLCESQWAERVPGIKRLIDRSREWRALGDDALTEE
ncbi:hypothetical protein VTO42DRAFT_349 [Malbranchea cinnamomea]